MSYKVERGSFSKGSPGTATVILNENPTMIVKEVTFFTGPAGTSDNDSHSGDGFMTATQQQARGSYADNTVGDKTGLVNTKCIAHIANIGGTPGEVITATKPASPFATPGQFDVTFSAANSSFPIFFIAKGE